MSEDADRARISQLLEERWALVSCLQGVLHQLSTDSDLDLRVSQPAKYDSLEAHVRETLGRVGGLPA